MIDDCERPEWCEVAQDLQQAYALSPPMFNIQLAGVLYIVSLHFDDKSIFLAQPSFASRGIER